MPIILTGKPTNVLTPFAIPYSSIANNGSGAARVHTSIAHEFGDGDTVNMSGGGGPQIIDFPWVIAVIDATHFDLVGSTFTSTGTGTVTDISLIPAVSIPLDGESATMNDVIPVLQLLLDRTQFLQAKSAIGTARLVASGLLGFAAGSGWGNTSSYVHTLGATPGPVYQGQIIPDSLSFVGGLAVGDVVQVWANYSVTFAASVAQGWAQLEFFERYTGSGSSTGFSGVGVEQSIQTTTDGIYGISLMGTHTIVDPGTSADGFAIFVNGKVTTSVTGDSHWKLSQGGLYYQVWRPNV